MLTTEQVDSEIAPLLTPVSPDAPAGHKPTLDPQYEELRTLLKSLDSPTGGEVEWPHVYRLSKAVLTTSSKDMLAAGAASYALYQTRGLEGLAIATAFLNRLFDTYWDTMFPAATRLRGRGNALDWFVSRLETTLPSLSVTEDDHSAFKIVETEWQTLSGTARDKLADHCPSMRGVVDALQRIKLRLPDPKPSSETPPAATPTPTASPSPTPSAPPLAATQPPIATPPPTAESPPAAPTPASSTANTATEAQDPIEQLLEQAAVWLEPITADNPTGDDPRYDETYETTKSEVAKLDSPTSDLPDWKTVLNGGDVILKTKAKDLLMASYWAFARFQELGLDSVSLSLLVLSELLERYVDTIHPKRPRGRGNALGWLVGQLEHGLGTVKLESKDRQTVVRLEAVVKRFISTVRTQLGDHAPGLSPLSDRITRMLLAVPAPKPEPAPTPPPAAATPPQQQQPQPTPATPQAPPAAPRQAAAPSGPMPAVAQANISNPEEVTRYLLEAGKGLTQAGNMLRTADIANPAAYRLVRQGLWLHIATPPPSNAGGKTQVPPLPTQRRKQFDTIAANGKWAALIEETESALSMFRFNLDLNFLSWTALDGLGHEPAKIAIASEVASLLKRIPSLLELTAGDGSAFASADTQTWIAQHVLAGDGEETGGRGPKVDDPGEQMAEARKLMKAKKAAEAMKIAQQAIDGAGPRLRLLRRIVLAESILETGQAPLARGMFAALHRELESRQLFEWEPALASRILEGLVKSLRTANKAGAKLPGLEDAFERLCYIDPAAAARLSA